MVLPAFQGLSTGVGMVAGASNRQERIALDRQRLALQKKQVKQADDRLTLSREQFDQSKIEWEEANRRANLAADIAQSGEDRESKKFENQQRTAFTLGFIAQLWDDGYISEENGIASINKEAMKNTLNNRDQDPAKYKRLESFFKQLHEQQIPNAPAPDALKITPQGEIIATTPVSDVAPQGSVITENRSTSPNDKVATGSIDEVVDLFETSYMAQFGSTVTADADFANKFGKSVADRRLTAALAVSETVETAAKQSNSNPAVISSALRDMSVSVNDPEGTIVTSDQILKALTNETIGSSYINAGVPSDLQTPSRDASFINPITDPITGEVDYGVTESDLEEAGLSSKNKDSKETGMAASMPNFYAYEPGKIYSDEKLEAVFDNDPRPNLKVRTFKLKQFNTRLRLAEENLAKAEPGSANEKRARNLKKTIIAQQENYIKEQNNEIIKKGITEPQKRKDAADERIKTKIKDLKNTVNSDATDVSVKREAQEKITELEAQLSTPLPVSSDPKEEAFADLSKKIGESLADVRINAFDPEAFTRRLKTVATNEDVEKVAKLAEERGVKTIDDIDKLESTKEKLYIFGMARIFNDDPSLDNRIALQMSNLRETDSESISALQAENLRQGDETERRLSASLAETIRQNNIDNRQKYSEKATAEAEVAANYLDQASKILTDAELNKQEQATRLNRLLTQVRARTPSMSTTARGAEATGQMVTAVSLEVFDLASQGALNATITEDVTSFFRRARSDVGSLTPNYIQRQGDNIVITKDPFDPEDPGKVREQVGKGISIEKFNRAFGNASANLLQLIQAQERTIKRARGQDE